MERDFILPQAGFTDLWSPELILLTLAAAILYAILTGTGRNRFKDAEKVSGGQKFLFYFGLLVFYISTGSPLNYYGHHFLFTGHMIQQGLMYFVAPPFLILGIPKYLWRALFRMAVVKKLFAIHPLVATVLFNVIFSFYHFPSIFDAIMTSTTLMFISHTVIFIFSGLMWWHIVCPLPEQARLFGLRKIGYIFLSGILLLPACGLLIFAGTTIYTVYLDAPRIFASLPVVDDQQLGGILMKVIQELAFAVALVLAFYEWYRKENPADGVDLSMEGPEYVMPGQLAVEHHRP